MRKVFILLLSVWTVLVGCGGRGGSTSNTTPSIKEYTIPTSSSYPSGGIITGPDGNLWFTEYEGSKIGKITPAGVITEYALSSGTIPYGITSGPDGNLWFTEYNSDKIGEITAAGAITEYAGLTGWSPSAITYGPDKNIWFTDPETNSIGVVNID